ncbi:DUF6174 domain-containing protein [Deinococcus sp.]|uniref:DUF6174 domain-containing protein n=1 Tax=Deinococcus sp. TaxID=47478 RepID=UPI0025C28EFA|nr:DUF6174 domain-containing protein [Deinococcus sp.]
MKKICLTASALLALAACSPAEKRQGCVGSYNTPDFTRLDTELAAAKQRWAQAGIQNYTYTPRISNFGTISGGTQQTAVVVQGGQVQGGETRWPALTMEGHFAEIAKEIASARAPRSCLILDDVKYDPADGHVLSYFTSNLTEGLRGCLRP